MSLFAERASQISVLEPRVQRSQLRADAASPPVRVVWFEGFPAKRRDVVARRFAAFVHCVSRVDYRRFSSKTNFGISHL